MLSEAERSLSISRADIAKVTVLLSMWHIKPEFVC